MLQLNNIGLYKKLLKDTNNAVARKYAGILVPISDDLNQLLEYVKKNYPNFPDHGFQHSLRILNYISILLGNDIEELTPTECFCIILTAFFHDTAMAEYTERDTEKVRKEHHLLSYKVIEEYFNEKLILLEERDRIKSVVEFACKAHGMDLYDFQKDKSFNLVDTINGDRVRYSLLGYLIRIGDLMDLEQERTNSFILSKFEETYTTESFNHNIRNRKVQIYNYDSTEIKITVLAEDNEQYKIWKTWFSYLENDILNANTDLNRYELFFPKPTTEIIKSKNVNVDVEEIHFEIDDEGKIWNILSQSIYTDEFDFLREIIQNAIDASLICVYKDTKIQLNVKSPRFWDADVHCEPILVCYSEIENKIIIIDSGIGMDREDLDKFLFKISGSGYKNHNERNFSFPGIAKFGIGFVSCLVNANDIDVFTKKEHEQVMNQVSLSTNMNLAFLQAIECNEYKGTTIKLSLKKQFTYNKVVDYIKKTFVYPSVPIQCINIDKLMVASNNMNLDDDLHAAIDKPYKFRDFLYNFEQCKTNLDKPIQYKLKGIDVLDIELGKLIDWVDANKEENLELTDKVKYSIFKEKRSILCDLINNLEITEIKIPTEIMKIDQKLLFNETNTCIEYFQKFMDEITKIRNRIGEEKARFAVDNHDIRSSIVSLGFSWQNMLLVFNDKLQICDIKYNVNKHDLEKKSGIILINEQFTDACFGLEFSFLNGFLFTNGEIFKNITVFRKVAEEFYRQASGVTNILLGTDEDFVTKQDLEELLYEKSMDDEFDFSYIYDDFGRANYGARFLNEYDSVTVYNNEFVKVRDVNLKDYISYDFMQTELEPYIKNRKKSLFSMDNYTGILSRTKDFYDDERQISLVAHACSGFYQDGIAIPLDIESIFPIGFFKIICNCTADARTNLNVTRHKASELKSDIEPWVNSVVVKIQDVIMDKVNRQLYDLGLSYNFEQMINSNTKSNSILLNECIKKLRRKKEKVE